MADGAFRRVGDSSVICVSDNGMVGDGFGAVLSAGVMSFVFADVGHDGFRLYAVVPELLALQVLLIREPQHGCSGYGKQEPEPPRELAFLHCADA